MKIIYVTDIHDALKELRVLLSSTEADLYLLSGDILYKAFYDEANVYDFVCLQDDFNQLLRTYPEFEYPYDFTAEILRFPEKFAAAAPDVDLVGKASEFRRLYHLATKTMKEKYELIEGLIQKYGNAECLLLPGNYDIDLRYTALSARSIHQGVKQIGGLKFGGYGGAPVATSGIPQKLAVVFHERIEDGILYSDPETFFNEEVPDVCVIHNPAYGYFDRIPSMGHMGSIGIRNHLDNHSPALVVSGHVHEDYGIAKKNGTILLNPSNFGGVDSLTGWQAGGTYAEIDFEGKQVKGARLMQLIEEKSKHLMNFKIEENSIKGEMMPDAQTNCPLDLSIFVRDSNGQPVT